MLTNNQITENIVYIRDHSNLSRTDRDQLAHAANRIQEQGKELEERNRSFEEWFEEEHVGHSVHDHEHQAAYERWKEKLKTAFLAGRSSRQ